MAGYDAAIIAKILAEPRSDEELADLVHHLSDILQTRLNTRPREGSALKRVIDNARIEVRSWTSARQQQIHEYLHPDRPR